MTSQGVLTGFYILAGVITVAGAAIWLQARKSDIIRLISPSARKSVTFLGIHRIHRNRRKALHELARDLSGSKRIRVMNLKGRALIGEPEIPDTLLHHLLSESTTDTRIDVLLHLPDSPSVVHRASERGSGYTVERMQREQAEAVAMLRDIAARFPGRIAIRWFWDAVAAWNLVAWDTGMLVGWYERDRPAHSDACVELSGVSVLSRMFTKHFDALWERGSVADDLYRTAHSQFPSGDAYPRDVVAIESTLVQRYALPPSRENAFVVLIGGGAGTGKSTLASYLAQSLGVRNVVSTDMIRQILRQDGSAPPVVSSETWEAWRFSGSEKNADSLYAGLALQSQALWPSAKSLVEYALSKGMPTIIEGIHVLPTGEWCSLLEDRRCIMFFVSSTEERIESNFELRKHSTHMRGTREDFAALDDRMTLHHRMIQAAREARIPVVESDEWQTLFKKARQVAIEGLSQSVTETNARLRGHAQS